MRHPFKGKNWRLRDSVQRGRVREGKSDWRSDWKDESRQGVAQVEHTAPAEAPQVWLWEGRWGWRQGPGPSGAF